MNDVFHTDCAQYLQSDPIKVDLTFVDPPFNQGKDYSFHNDSLPETQYWDWMREICANIHKNTSAGGAIYFMQREKNTEQVLRCLREAGWTLQNIIIWKKMTSAVPGPTRYGKHYQIIAYATKGERPRVFNKLRITPPLPANYKYDRENGMYVTDIWDDIRELTSGYFAGDEAIRKDNGERFHKQQAPLALLIRIILSSSKVGDTIFDPFAGTGTTLVAAKQLSRGYLGIEIDPENVKCIQERLQDIRSADNISGYLKDYQHTENLADLWGSSVSSDQDILNLPLFRGPVPEEDTFSF